MGKTQASPRLGEGRIGSRCLTQDGNRRVPLTEVKEGDSQIAKHGKSAGSEGLALFEAEAGWLEPAVFKMLNALGEQGTRLRKRLVGRGCGVSHDRLPMAESGTLDRAGSLTIEQPPPFATFGLISP